LDRVRLQEETAKQSILKMAAARRSSYGNGKLGATQEYITSHFIQQINMKFQNIHLYSKKLLTK
jgi:hypothetical protein